MARDFQSFRLYWKERERYIKEWSHEQATEIFKDLASDRLKIVNLYESLYCQFEMFMRQAFTAGRSDEWIPTDTEKKLVDSVRKDAAQRNAKSARDRARRERNKQEAERKRLVRQMEQLDDPENPLTASKSNFQRGDI